MASNLPSEIIRIRRLMGDRVLGELVIPTATIEEIMVDAMDEIAREAGIGDVRTTGFVTVGSTGFATLTTTNADGLRHLKHLVRESDGRPLGKTDYESILASRAFGGGEFGAPTQYSLRTHHSSATFAVVPTAVIDVYPTPQNPEVLTAVWEPVLSQINLLTGQIILGLSGLLAMRNRTAGRVLLSLSAENLKKLGKDRGFAKELLGVADKAVVDEFQRNHPNEMQDHVIRLRRGP